MSLAEQIEQCRKNKHNSRTEKYLKTLQHKYWRRFCKSQNELKPLYNRYKFWEGKQKH